MQGIVQNIQNIHAPVTMWEFLEWLIGAIIIGIICTLPWTWQWWKYIFGILKSMLVTDISKDPKAAAAAFDELIEQKLKLRGDCDKKLAGLKAKLGISTDNLMKLAQERDELIDAARAAKRANDMDNAMEYAKNVALQDELIEIEKGQNKILADSVESLKKALKAYDEEINETRRKKKSTVARLEAGQAVQSIYQDLSEMRNKSVADDLVDAAMASADDVTHKAVYAAESYAESEAGQRRAMKASANSTRAASILKDL